MAKSGGKIVGRDSGLVGPLYVQPSKGESLGAHRVEGPRGPLAPPDPTGVTHGLHDDKPAPSRTYTRVAPNHSTHAEKD